MIPLLAAVLLFQAQLPTVESIMARVAANQASAQEARKQWIYQQSVMVRLHKSNGKLSREELRDYLVTPTPDGTEKHLQHFAGKYEEGGKLHDYDTPGFEHKSIDIDADLAKDLAEDLANEKHSKDGIAKDMFPLTAKEQAQYAFTLAGKELYRGQDVYKVTFRPREGEAPWKGEALIDVQDFQPVVVTTTLGQKIPLLVKTMLGTDIQHLGFKLTYKKVADGVWFPDTYGGEFYVRAVFLFKRKISLSLTNSDFRKTDVSTAVTFEKQP